MNREQQLEKIKWTLNGLPDKEMVYIHNEYCEKNNYYDDMIYFMNELDDVITAETPTQIIRTYGNINVNDYYFVLTMYSAESFNYYKDAPITYYEEIAEDIVDYDYDFKNSKIREVLDEILKEEE